MNVLARLQASGARLAVLSSGTLVCAAVLSSAAQAQAAAHGAHAAGAHRVSGAIHMTAAQAAAWRHDTATRAGRERIVSAFRTAFGDVAEASPGQRTYQAGRMTANGPVRPALSYGITFDHFWIIASYSDAARGLIDVGVAACKRAVPEIGFVCSAAGNWLKSLAAGWGAVSNHGVWAALYWLPPHFTGGRW